MYLKFIHTHFFNKLSFILLFSFIQMLSFGQALVNNPCNLPSPAGAQWPLDGVCYATTTAGFTNLYNPGTCNSGTRDDGWAWFVGDGNNITVLYNPDAGDPVMHVFSAVAPCTVTEVGCSDNCCNNVNETVTISPSVLGQVYFVRIQRWNSNNTETGCLSVTSTVPPPPGNGDNCAGAIRITCGDPVLVGESTTSNTDDENAWACYAPISTPGGDRYYVVQWPDAAAGGTIRLNFTNVSDANDTYMEVLALGSSCSPNACVDGSQMIIATGLFSTALNFIEYNVGAGVADYYFVVDAQNNGITSYDLEVTCFTTGLELDVDNGCTPIPVTEPVNQGYYQTWNGAAPPDTVFDPASMSGTYTVCENVYVQNVGWEWLKYFDITLGACWINATNFSPNGNNTGFHSLGSGACSGNPGGLSGRWDASLAGNVISWAFLHPWRNNPPCVDVTAWGDGNQLNNNYTCALYTFCYDAEVDPACSVLTGFQNGISATDDGIGGGGGGSVNPSNITLGTTSPTVLPIKLLSFNADVISNNSKYAVALNWKTLIEVNNDYFTIERSVNGVDFEEVLKVQGAGNSSELNNYITVDENPHKGVSYYRLKQTDFNGEYEYFDMVAVNVSNINEFTFYPNPVKDKLKISFKARKSGDEIFVKIYDAIGSLVFDKIIITENKLNEASFDMREFSQGLYFITVENEGEVKRMKFIKE